ncbi:MAG: hypothetical protein IJN90_07775 [Bacilli bacterium]|nr:hypothetical protein [Bacilli bacterium]
MKEQLEIDFEKKELDLLAPHKACIYDFDTEELDTAKHPVVFVVNNYNYDNSYGFKLTSHPDESTLDDFFYVEITGDDLLNSNKESSTIKCDHIVLFGEGLENKNLRNYFYTKGTINPNRYNEIMTNVITRHVLLQEQGLATKDPNTEYLLMELELDKEKIISSPLYQKLEKDLTGAHLPMGPRLARQQAIEAQRQLVKSIEEAKGK